MPCLVQINVSPGGVPKRPVPSASVTFARVSGDDWSDKRFHGGTDQAVCLFAIELIEELKAEGFPLFPGALGENLTTEGLDYRRLRLGDTFRIGENAVIRISKVRVPCRTITVYGQGIIKATYDSEVRRGNTTSPRWGRSGFYARVLKEGMVFPGDQISQVGESFMISDQYRS